MAVIRDNMPAFELFQPATHRRGAGVTRSVWLERRGCWPGGLDTWDWLKDRVKRPSAVVDLGGIAALREIEDDGESGAGDRGDGAVDGRWCGRPGGAGVSMGCWRRRRRWWPRRRSATRARWGAT